MAAPERFAKTSDSSCTAGAVHTWPDSVNIPLQDYGGYRGRSSRASVIRDPRLLTELDVVRAQRGQSIPTLSA